MSPPSAIKVLHITPRISRLGGGVTEAIWGLVRATQTNGVAHTAVAVRDPWTQIDMQTAPAGCDVRTFEQKGPPSAFFSPLLGRYLRETLHGHDIVHVHSIRHWPGFAARRCAVAQDRPLLISLHGMLYPEHLRRSPIRKALTHRFIENETLRRAHCLHATSDQELAAIRDFGCSNPVAVLPLGIQSAESKPSNTELTALFAKYPTLVGKRILLYLGMLDPKKGLLRLTQAWARVHRQFPQWHLAIAGPDVGGFEAQLRAAIQSASLEAGITLLGPIYGRDKRSLLQASDVLILPSDWENFGIVIGEALAAGLPVIATRRSPWQVVERHQCGWWIDTSIDAIVNSLEQALVLSKHELEARGERGTDLIRHNYNWESIGRRMATVYEWLSGRGPRADCVDIAA